MLSIVCECELFTGRVYICMSDGTRICVML
jgi:hypothetical protein